MPMVITKTCGMPNRRRTFSNVSRLVVRVRSTHRETDVKTRMKKMAAPAAPCLVMLRLKPAIPKLNRGSPGLNTFKRAGRAIKSANMGIKSHVRFRKYHGSIEETAAKNRQSK